VIKRIPIDFMELELYKLQMMGFRYDVLRRYKGRNGYVNLVDIRTHVSPLVESPEKLYGRPYPGLNIDNLPFFAVIATQAKGTTLIHDWAYEGRALYFAELNKLGAKAILADPHRVFIEGRTPLRAGDLTCPPALRPAAILLIAMLAAKGTSTLKNIYSINRGYEGLAEKLQSLGAKVEVFEG
jgi:UDP-N-acetylglucosamine 1-carboxyvinyltransferase